MDMVNHGKDQDQQSDGAEHDDHDRISQLIVIPRDRLAKIDLVQSLQSDAMNECSKPFQGIVHFFR